MDCVCFILALLLIPAVFCFFLLKTGVGRFALLFADASNDDGRLLGSSEEFKWDVFRYFFCLRGAFFGWFILLSFYIYCLSNEMGTYIMFEKDYSYRNVGDVCL